MSCVNETPFYNTKQKAQLHILFLHSFSFSCFCWWHLVIVQLFSLSWRLKLLYLLETSLTIQPFPPCPAKIRDSESINFRAAIWKRSYSCLSVWKKKVNFDSSKMIRNRRTLSRASGFFTLNVKSLSVIQNMELRLDYTREWLRKMKKKDVVKYFDVASRNFPWTAVGTHKVISVRLFGVWAEVAIRHLHNRSQCLNHLSW